MIINFRQEQQYLVYKHTCRITNKSYIGQTCDWESRNKTHARPSSGCVAFRNAIQKYGWDNFTHEILVDSLTLEEANKIEEMLIAEHNTLAPVGYNIRSGGQNKLIHETTKKKISEKLKGRTVSVDTIAKRKKTRTGIKQTANHIANAAAARTGLIRTNEQRKRMSLSHTGRIVAESTKQKIGLGHRGLKYVVSTCPNCGISGAGGAMKRWHFGSCRQAQRINT